jgi:hypothetical protein
LIQAGTADDVLELRRYLGLSYGATIDNLNNKNQILLRNTATLAPAQAAEMRNRMKAPAALPAGNLVLNVRVDNVGQGLVTFLFEDDFLTEAVNFFFCPAQPDRSERVMAIQVLLDDRRALQPTVTLLQTIYQMPRPIGPGSDYKLAFMYPVSPNLPLTVWDLGNVEAVYQPIQGQQLVSGQFWLADKTVAAQCASPPKLDPNAARRP